MIAFVLRNIRVGCFCLFFLWFQLASGWAQTSGSGLHFDGTNDYVSFASGYNSFGKEMTFECWVQVGRTVAGSGIQQAVIGQNIFVWMLHGIPAGNGFRFYMNFNPDAKMSPDIILDNGWHHLAATGSQDGLKVYVDGVLTSTVTHSRQQVGIRNDANSKLVMGWDARYLTGNRFFQGIFDEVRVWNRELCQAEIQHNMNKELDPTVQTGLVYYYKFSNGVANGTNTGITTLADLSGNGNNGTLTSFALTGSTSNWTGGKTLSGTASLFSPSTLAATSGGSQVCRTTEVLSSGLNYNDASCQLISRIAATGASPVSGSVTTCVTIDAAVQSYNGDPYVQRHYDITPASNPTTSTGTVTLYFIQTEFDDFNLARGSAPALPASPSDVAGIANIRVTKYGGTGTAPGNYTGETTVIDPVDSDIVWDADNQRWAVTISVTGFSGFYLTTSNTFLPVQLLSFQGHPHNGFNQLRWKVVVGSASRFSVQRSTNGNDFVSIAEAVATASDGHYTFMDSIRWYRSMYYRLQMEDKEGIVTYSPVVKLGGTVASEFSIYPNPTQSNFMVQVPARFIGQTAYLMDASGRTIHAIVFTSSLQQINVDNLPRGLYTLWVGNEFKRLMLR